MVRTRRTGNSLNENLQGAGRVDGVASVGIPIFLPISRHVLMMITTEARVSFQLKRQEYETKVQEKTDF